MTTPLESLALAVFDGGPEGLTRSRINAVFCGHLSALELDRLLALLDEAGAVRRWWVPTDGRWATRWAPCDGAPVEWAPDEINAFWRAWCAVFRVRAATWPFELKARCRDAGSRGVTLAHAVEALDRYRRATPAPSISDWQTVLKMALPVRLAG